LDKEKERKEGAKGLQTIPTNLGGKKNHNKKKTVTPHGTDSIKTEENKTNNCFQK